ncbi:aryl-sulfate sulfotransferase [Nonlabens sp. Asnod3-A02]|uniref:aryl-sulfate sulfotransferase n=1 Tax=Nonlabens sp. Asnod3-A02 TaxID=3160579 RepID=UPI00386DB4DA
MLLILTSLIISCNDDEAIEIITDPVPTIQSNITVYDVNNLTDDYVFISPFRENTSFLIDRLGNILHRWTSSESVFMAYLREDGSAVRAINTGVDNGINLGGNTGAIEIIDKENNQIWKWTLDTPTDVLHHDIALLPNGNILASVWTVKDRIEAIENGRDPSTIIDDKLVIDRIIEIQPIGTNQANIVWEWSVWDHLVQDFDASKLNFGNASNAQLFDINQSTEGINFTHGNGLDYIPSLDQIILNSRVLNEFIIIDHNTSTTQAATSTGGRYNRGGDILYRWGNPASYNSGTINDQQLHDQHDATFVGNNNFSRGTFLVFDNQDSSTFSTIKEININVTADGFYDNIPTSGNNPTAPIWTYSSPEILSPRTSGAQRLDSGNTLITSTSSNVIREVNYNNEVVWEMDASIEVNGELEINSSGFKSRSYSKIYDGVIALDIME